MQSERASIFVFIKRFQINTFHETLVDTVNMTDSWICGIVVGLSP